MYFHHVKTGNFLENYEKNKYQKIFHKKYAGKNYDFIC